MPLRHGRDAAVVVANHRLVIKEGCLRSAWQADVIGFCTKALENRYPMVRASPTDVNLDDFSRLFKPGGMIDIIPR